MPKPHRSRPAALAAVAPAGNQTVLWIIAILLAILATLLFTRAGDSMLPMARADTPMMGGRGIFAFTGQIDRDRYGLFMMDVDNSTVWAYEYLPGTRKLRLAFARSFTFDRYLEEYGNDEDTQPLMIKNMLEAQREKKERDARKQAGEPDEGVLSTSVPGMPASAEER